MNGKAPAITPISKPNNNPAIAAEKPIKKVIFLAESFAISFVAKSVFILMFFTLLFCDFGNNWKKIFPIIRLK